MKSNDLVETLSHHGVTLVAVTKNQALERVLPLYEAGLRDFGENRVQDLLIKYEALPKDIRWHLIGHLQTNKVKFIAPFVHLIHSIDSLKLLAELDKNAGLNNRVVDFLLQVHVAEEESKFGFSPDALRLLVDQNALAKFKNVRLRGLMAMATNTDDRTQIANEFTIARQLFASLQHSFPEASPNAMVDTLSMGMSSDYEIALEHGSNLVRIGSLLFND
ncbi:MAG TPA: YggS family pyridoxal phosphate-dependent enzyme [Chitinophagales bacterium]|nr:YggS family pyridoxal phosphate-dependent enzyme [Chitinophagales bacterium]